MDRQRLEPRAERLRRFVTIPLAWLRRSPIATSRTASRFYQIASRMTAATCMRILYFADIRFPLERANGIQTMETCHALAARGHDVHLVVRPDTQHAAARSVRLLRPAAASHALVIERAQRWRAPALLARSATCRSRSAGARHRPRRRRHHARSRASRRSCCGCHAACGRRSSTNPTATRRTWRRAAGARRTASRAVARRSCGGWPARGAVWRGADGYVTITQGWPTISSARSGRGRGCGRPRRRASRRPRPGRAAACRSRPVVGYAGHL